jgi:hypothetical protein
LITTLALQAQQPLSRPYKTIPPSQHYVCGAFGPAPVAKLPLLQQNRDLWRHQYWTYANHEGFSALCHAMVITSFLCGDTCPSCRLPLRLWRTIFSFWKRQDFFLKEPYFMDK